MGKPHVTTACPLLVDIQVCWSRYLLFCFVLLDFRLTAKFTHTHTHTHKKKQQGQDVVRVYLLVDELLKVVEDVGVVRIQGHKVLHRVVLRLLLCREPELTGGEVGGAAEERRMKSFQREGVCGPKQSRCQKGPPARVDSFPLSARRPMGFRFNTNRVDWIVFSRSKSSKFILIYSNTL